MFVVPIVTVEGKVRLKNDRVGDSGIALLIHSVV